MTKRPSAPVHRGTRAVRRLAWAGLLCGGLLGTLVFAPARWLAAALPDHAPMQLTQARGSLWQGSAQLWLQAGSGGLDRAALPGRVHWQLQWTGLRPALHLQAECCTPQGLQLSLGLQQARPVLRLADALSAWPAEVLAGLGTPWNTLQPSGQLALRTQDLALHLGPQGPRPSGLLTLDLQDLGSALSTLRPLGSYRLQVQAGERSHLQLQTLRGELLLSGQGSWQGTGLSFRGEARAAPGREDALGNILQIIGKRDGARTLLSLG